jgi:hypothetical protein
MMGLSLIGDGPRKGLIQLQFGVMEYWNDGIMGLVEKNLFKNANLLRF